MPKDSHDACEIRPRSVSSSATWPRRLRGVPTTVIGSPEGMHGDVRHRWLHEQLLAVTGDA